MRAIQELSGQEYVDRDAGQYKREMERERGGSIPGRWGSKVPTAPP